MANYETPKFIQNGTISIANNVLGIAQLAGVLTETHFTDQEKLCVVDGRDIFRLGRFLCFMGSILLSPPNGLGATSVQGLAVDDGTALTVTSASQAKVWGSKNVYFASAGAAVGGTCVCLDPGDPGQATLEVSNVYMRWFDTSDGWFSLSDAWTIDTSINRYAIYALEEFLDENGNPTQGSHIVLLAGSWPSTFPSP